MHLGGKAGKIFTLKLITDLLNTKAKLVAIKCMVRGSLKGAENQPGQQKKLPSNINGLKIAHATTLSPPSKYYKFLPKQAYLGVYETSIPDRNAGKTIITLTCENKIGCKIETARIKEGEYPHTNHNGKRLYPQAIPWLETATTFNRLCSIK